MEEEKMKEENEEMEEEEKEEMEEEENVRPLSPCKLMHMNQPGLIRHYYKVLCKLMTKDTPSPRRKVDKVNDESS
eukprot:6083440-Ditylum_brightwellii.AAC.1